MVFFHIHMMNEVFLITNILVKFLQNANITLTDALAKVNIAIGSFQSLQYEYEFKRIWDDIMEICVDNDIDEPTERRKRKFYNVLAVLKLNFNSNIVTV